MTNLVIGLIAIVITALRIRFGGGEKSPQDVSEQGGDGGNGFVRQGAVGAVEV